MIFLLGGLGVGHCKTHPGGGARVRGAVQSTEDRPGRRVRLGGGDYLIPWSISGGASRSLNDAQVGWIQEFIDLLMEDKQTPR